MYRAVFAPLFAGALVVAPACVASQTTTAVRTVAGVQVIMSGVTVVTSARARRKLRLPKSNASIAARRARAKVFFEAPAPLSAGRLVQTALSLVGTRYVWGGASPSGFDCSGFTSYVYGRLGIAIPRTADLQFAAGRPVRDPQPGDLVFFQTYDWGASHVGIYLGDWRFVNALGANVHVTTFASEYFRSRYLGARRFLPSA